MLPIQQDRKISRDAQDEPLVIVLVLNTNRREDVLACLASLRISAYRNWKAVVLENGSTDGSCEAIQRDFPEVHLVPLARNLGYAGNNNLGLTEALASGADWILLLNEDTVVAPDCLSKLIEAGEADPRIGIVGPMVYHFDAASVIQSAGGKLDRVWSGVHIGQNELDRGQYRETRAVDWISGCGILIRAVMLREIGCLDERYFYYWEETELCIRARAHGWKVVHVPSARIWHKGVQKNYRPSPSVTYYDTRNRLLTLSKHHAPASAWLGTCLQLARTLTSWSLRPKWRDKRTHRDAMWQGITDYWRGRFGPRPEVESTAKSHFS